jgi:lipopolysaccharide export LptBFGC system permease protein LptF
LRRSSSVRGELREQTLGELARSARELPSGEPRDLARAELGSRLALVLSFPPLALVAAALGLLVVRGGAWIGTAAGVSWVGAVHLPCLSFAARHVADGGSPLVFALLVLPLVASVPLLRSWRCG